MKKENNNINYTAKDIQKYLNAELSDSEMQAMEKAALSDPFLADAMEGYGENSNHAESFETAVEDLQRKLSDRIRKNENKSPVLQMLSKWKVAAAVLIILGATLFTYRYATNKPSADIAIQPVKDSGIKIQAPAKANHAADTLQPQRVLISPDKPTAKDKPVNETESEKKDAVPSVASAAPAQKEAPQESAETISPSPKNEESVARSKSINVQLDDRVPGPGISSAPAISENYIKGVVVDKKGKPIPYANVKIKGFKKGTFTDTAGFFKLYMKDPRLAALIVSHPPDFESVSTEIAPDSSAVTTIEMESSPEDLNAVVSLGITKSAAKKSRNSPVSGMDSFTAYIEANKKINSADSLRKGMEIISFIVNKDGSLSSFKIEKSISEAHDTEILRLIKSGPPLKTTSEKKQRVQVNIVF